MPFMNEMNDHANTAQYSIIGPGAFFHQKVLVAFEFMKRCASPTAGKKKRRRLREKRWGRTPSLPTSFSRSVLWLRTGAIAEPCAYAPWSSSVV